MAVQSIRAPVQVGDMAGNHLLVSPCEMPFGKVNGIRELNHLPQEVRSRSEAFDDAGNLLPARAGPPKVIGGGGFAGRLSVFDDSNFGR